MKPKKPRQPNNHQKIIQRFVTVEFSAVARTFWPNEMRIAGQLIKKYGIDFLLWMVPPNNYKVSSLVWFLTGQGKHYLSDQLFEYQKLNTNLSPKQETIVESNTKVGEDVQILKRPRTLQDFINYGKEGRQAGTEGGLQQAN